MREVVHKYLNTFTPFNMFGTEHWLGLVIALLIIVILPVYAKRNLSPKRQQTIGIIIGLLVMSNYIVWVGLEAIAGTFDIKQHLPLHLCRFANLMMPLIMIWRNYFVYEILFFWGLSAMLQAAITPDIVAGFPHFHYFRFWIGHQGLILGLIYATVVYEMRPTFMSLFKAMVVLNIFLIISAAVNYALDANYFWICAKPVNHLGERIPTLLDFMGPWPWYILTGEFVAMAHFILAYSPFYFLNKQKVTT